MEKTPPASGRFGVHAPRIDIRKTRKTRKTPRHNACGLAYLKWHCRKTRPNYGKTGDLSPGFFDVGILSNLRHSPGAVVFFGFSSFSTGVRPGFVSH